MPYKVMGSDVMQKVNGKWMVKQHAKNHENAVKAMRLLYVIEKKSKG